MQGVWNLQSASKDASPLTVIFAISVRRLDQDSGASSTKTWSSFPNFVQDAEFLDRQRARDQKRNQPFKQSKYTAECV